LRKTIVPVAAQSSLSQKHRPQLFLPIVKWITFVCGFPGQAVVHRAAQADFNVRGWQGRLALYCADGLVFLWPDPRRIGRCLSAGSSQAGDLPSAAIVWWNVHSSQPKEDLS
jgi:hypothetical protein